MSKILTNTTSSDVFVTDTGTTVPASSSYTIPPQYYPMWVNSANIVTLINAGTITVANAVRSLPTTALMIAEIQGLPGIAEDVFFDNSTDGFAATQLQAAIEEGGGTPLNIASRGVKRDSTASFASTNIYVSSSFGGIAATGTNTTGQDVVYGAGASTGTANSGNIIFKTSNAASNSPSVGNIANFVTTSVSTYSASFNAGSLANSVLVVQLDIPNGSSGNSITYNGISLTKLTGAGSATNDVEFWYLIAPATGSNTLTVVLQNPAVVIIEAMIFANVNQTTPFSNTTIANGTGTAATITTSSSSGNFVLDMISAGAVPTTSASQTAIWNGTNGAGLSGASSYKTAPGSSTVSSYSLASSASWAMIGVVVNGLSSGSTNTLVEVARITPTGRLGVGTTAPAYTVDVNGAAAATSLILKGSSAGTVTLSIPASTTTYPLVLPSAQGGTGTTPINDGSGNLSWVTSIATSQIFGDGSDGNISLSSGTTTLARTMYYNNLTLSGTAIINPNGFKIFVKGTLTISGSAGIISNGGAGVNATGFTGTAGGVGVTGIDFGSSQTGQTGGAGANNATPGNGNNAPAAIGYGGSGGVGGAGGTATSGAGGTGGTVGTYTYYPERTIRPDHIINLGYKTGGQSGASGGGGRGAVGSTSNGGGGGGSGAGGGVIIIFAAAFNNSSSIGVTANGGAGGNGAQASTGGVGNSSGGGGGGGGGGGFIYIITNSLVALGTISVTGGAAGTGTGGTVIGGNGAAGSSGHYTVYNGATNTWTVL